MSICPDSYVIENCLGRSSMVFFSFTDSLYADAASWWEGGNNNSPNSPTDQDAKALGQEDGNATPAEQSDGQKAAEMRDVRLPQIPQPKMNGQQQPPISSQYRAMMPPYVSSGYTKF